MAEITLGKNTYASDEIIVLNGTVVEPTAFSVTYNGTEVLLDAEKNFTIDLGGVLDPASYDIPLTVTLEDGSTSDTIVHIVVEAPVVAPTEPTPPTEPTGLTEAETQALFDANDSQPDFIPDYTVSKETDTSAIVSELGSKILYGPIETDAKRWPVRRNLHDTHGELFPVGNMTNQTDYDGDAPGLSTRSAQDNLVSGGFTF